jgi:hypothetical protein
MSSHETSLKPLSQEEMEARDPKKNVIAELVYGLIKICTQNAYSKPQMYEESTYSVINKVLHTCG